MIAGPAPPDPFFLLTVPPNRTQPPASGAGLTLIGWPQPALQTEPVVLSLNRVAGLTKDVSPLDQQACYHLLEPVDFVLEVPAGFCDRHSIRVGDKATW